MRDIGKNIRSLREERGMTQEELAQALFVTRQTVSNYETGRSRPDIEMLVRIAQVLETDANQVLYGLPAEQDKQREARQLGIGCLILAGLFLATTLPVPLLNEMLRHGYVGAVLTAAVPLLLKPAMWLMLGWCALQGLGLLCVARPLAERRWVWLIRWGLLLLLAVNVLLLLPLLIEGYHSGGPGLCRPAGRGAGGGSTDPGVYMADEPAAAVDCLPPPGIHCFGGGLMAASVSKTLIRKKDAV